MRSNAKAAAASLIDRWRFGIVLVAALVVAVGHPLASSLFDDQAAFDVGVSLLIMSVIVLVFEARQHRIIAIALGLAALGGLWSSYAFSGAASNVFVAASYLLTAAFFAFALFGIVRTILAAEASHNALLGAVSGYLLLGIIWSLLYATVETTTPRSFVMANRDAEEAPLDRGALSYYSFVTLSTVGYGDITPTTPLTRTLAWIEAVTGQFYLAVLVAGLVGFIVSQRPAMPSRRASRDIEGRNEA
jgi:hypothetical protein